MSTQIVADDADATRAFGTALSAVLRAGDLVVLTGGLGAGKTTLTQGIGAGLRVRGQVVSPTFTIARVQPSTVDGPALVHVDAYRLGSFDEVEALDLDASLDESVTVVEWGAGWVESLTADRLEVQIDRPRGDHADTDASDEVSARRQITVRAVGERWAGVPLPGEPAA
ncbi:MAG: tRNA (adenosine(37)-N6)-threonylcarbamoyltransferase complex ATPase subunit type 1 TsaE [Micrococcales bacterium]|nr:tRNA (adenosine(37)-N6)-threonylcarbamoyltransferase complex ATPase subunit type 1 TsaE [Micrococcales bacterium]